MTDTNWQDAMIDQLRSMLQDDPAVEILAVVGSYARGEHDAWSDLDLLLVVATGALLRFFPSTTWLEPLGAFFAVEQHPSGEAPVTRICFDDMRRLDVVIASSEVAVASDQLHRLAAGMRVLIARSDPVGLLEASAPEPVAPPPADPDFRRLCNDFWFKATVAVTKVVRGDLLVAAHLNLDLVRDGLVLAMMLRDRDTGSTVHRGGVGNELLSAVGHGPARYDERGIFDSIESSAIAFDRLAQQWSPGYAEKKQPLGRWIARARAAM